MPKLSFQSSRLNRIYPHISFVIALGLLLAAGYYYQPRFVGEFRGFYLLLLSLPFIRLAFPLILSSIPSVPAEQIPSSTLRPFWIGLAVIAMVLLTLMQIPVEWTNPIYETLGLVGTSPHVQMLLLLIGIGGLMVGFGGGLIPRIRWQKHHWFLLAILLMALIVRLWNLEYSIHMFVDELLIINGVNDIKLNTAKILLPQANPYTDVFQYFQFLVYQVIGPGLTALRAPTAIVGVLGVAGIYTLARQLFSVRVALLSAFLLATMPVHIHFSRVGINNIVGGVFATWYFVYLIRGMRDQRLSDFAIAGTLLGLTHYFYEGDRIFFTFFTVLWILWLRLFARRDPLFHMPDRKQLAVLIFCFSVIAVPIYYTLWSHNHDLTQRFTLTRSPDFMLRDSIRDFLLDSELGYIGTPIQRYGQFLANDNFYLSDYAFLLPYLVPFFLLGFGILLFQLLRVRGSLLIWWALGVAIANSLIFDAFSSASTRHAAVYMILMVLVAVGIDALWTVLSRWVRSRWIHFILVLVCIGVGIDQVSYYFLGSVPAFHRHVFTSAASTGGRLLPADGDMILRAVELPPDTSVHVFIKGLFPNDLKHNVPFFFDRAQDLKVESLQIADLTPNYFRALPRDRNHVFVFRPFYDDLLPTLQRYFTITKVEGSSFDIPYNVEMYFFYAPAEISSEHH